jgi:hypothetical protein
MKTLMLLLTFVSTSAFASINDFECRFNGENGEDILIEVERSYSPGMKRVNVNVTGDNTYDQYNYFTNARLNQMNRIEYFGAGMDLEIDLWPDSRPRMGRMYSSEFRSFDVNNGRPFYNIYCQYTGF